MILSLAVVMYELQKTIPLWSRDIILVPQMNTNKKRGQLGNRKIYHRRPLSVWKAFLVAFLQEPKVLFSFKPFLFIQHGREIN